MDEKKKLIVKQTVLKRYDVCLIHSGSEVEQQLDLFLQKCYQILGLKLGPMNHDFNDIDLAIFNENLKTIKESQFVLLIFCKGSRKSRRCRFERLFALHLHANYNLPVLIPIVIGMNSVPETYAIFQEIAIEQSSNWIIKLLKTLVQNTEICSERSFNKAISNDDKMLIERLSLEERDDYNYQEDLDELDTAFDRMCFHFLDDFVKAKNIDNDKSAEMDEILTIQSELCQKLEQSSLKTRMEFLKMNSNSGIASYVGQMGLNNVHWILMQGCGMTISKDQITLKWKTFEQNLLCSSITLADIVNFSKYARIKRIALQFDKESHEKISEYYGKQWQSLLVKFAERILQKRFSESEDEMLTYRVLFNGIVDVPTMHAINKSCRKLHFQRFVDHNQDFRRLEDRMKTYENWQDRWNSLELATAGFIYSGHGSVVTCFSCNQSLYGVTSERNSSVENETLLESHLYWSDNCPFLRSHPKVEDIREKIAAKSRFSSQQSPCLITPDMNSMADRIKTFDKSLPKFRCQTFAEAGFFQQFFEEDILIVRCFSCTVDITVKLSQDPWVEHVRWSPRCRFITDTKGESYVADVKKVLQLEGEDEVMSELIIDTILLKHEIDDLD